VGGVLTAFVLVGWLAIWGDIPGYLAFHIAVGQTAYTKLMSFTFSNYARSLIPSLRPDYLVQDLAVLFTVLGVLISATLAFSRTGHRIGTIASVLLVYAGVLLFNARGLVIFQDGTFLMAAIGLVAVALPASAATKRRPLGQPALIVLTCLCGAAIAATELTCRQALATPTPLTRAQMVALPRFHIAQRIDDPYFDKIRALTKPDERILVLVYRPDMYWAADRLPMDGFYAYLPENAIYAKAPWFGMKRDICVTLPQSPPPVIIFDNWAVWDLYRPRDYMPCIFDILARMYHPVPGFSLDTLNYPRMFVRADRDRGLNQPPLPQPDGKSD
jgi:hypothetical protein